MLQSISLFPVKDLKNHSFELSISFIAQPLFFYLIYFKGIIVIFYLV